MNWIEQALIMGDLKQLLGRILVLFVVVLIAILIDLIRGVQRAMRLGIARRSKGFRATIVKINEYFSFLTLFALIDIVVLLSGVLHTLGLSAAPIFPIATSCACFYPLFVEIRSVREKMSASRQRDLSDSLSGLAKLLQGATSADKSRAVEALCAMLEDDQDQAPNQDQASLYAQEGRGKKVQD